MKHFFLYLLAKYKYFVFVVLKPLGVWGLLALAFVDSSSIAVPMDPLVASYVWADKPRLLLYVLAAAIGSAAGSLVPFFIGRAGGELFLLKRINRERFEKLRDRFEKQEFLALLVPAMLPPPTPFKLFVFAAGVFEMRTASFLLAVASRALSALRHNRAAGGPLWAGDCACLWAHGASPLDTYADCVWCASSFLYVANCAADAGCAAQKRQRLTVWVKWRYAGHHGKQRQTEA